MSSFLVFEIITLYISICKRYHMLLSKGLHDLFKELSDLDTILGSCFFNFDLIINVDRTHNVMSDSV